MAIDIRTGAIVAGGIFGGYTSDITENPLTGILSTGIGMGMGAFMNLPETSFKQMSRVNVGPKTNIDYIVQQQELSQLGYNTDEFKTRLNSFYNRTKTPLDVRLSSLERSYDVGSSVMSTSTIQRQIRAKAQLESNFEKSLNKINSKFDKIINDRVSFNQNLLENRRGNTSLLEKSKEVAYYNRMITREEQSIARYLETPKGIKELASYDKWIESQRPHRKGFEGKDIWELRNSLFKEYTESNKRAFIPIKKRQDYYNNRLHKDKKDLFNPWFRDYKKDNLENNLDFENRSNDLLNTFKEETNQRRQREIELAKEKFIQEQQKIENWIDNSYLSSKVKRNNRLEKYNNKVEKVTTRYNQEKSVYNNLRNILRSNGINVKNSKEEIINSISTLEDESILKQVDLLLKNSDVNFINQSQLNVNQWKSKRIDLQSTDVKGLTNWLQNQLGNNALDAEQKAQMFLNRAKEGTVSLKDGTISFIDKVNDERVTIPLTSYNEEGLRYHTRGNGNYSVASQYNPYASAYIDGLEVNIDGVKRAITAQDVVKGYDPETMLKYLPEDKPISSILPKIESLFHYNSQEAGMKTNDLTSDMFRNNQNMVDLGTVLKYNQYGEIDSNFPLRKINQNSTKNMASERQRAYLKLAQELPPEQAANLMSGKSLGNLTSINTEGFNSLAVLAPNERGETSVGNRGTKVVNKNTNTQMLESIIGSEQFNKQFSSSQVLNRLDINDDKLFNSIVSSLYGNDYVLGDGAGFFNLGDSSSLVISDKSNIKIPLSNNIAISNPELLVGLTSKEGLSEYLKTNPINIDNTPIAFTEKGVPINLNKMYSSGKIVDGFMTDKDIRLVTEAVFDPTGERNMKFFSTGTKSLNTGVLESSFNIMSEIGLAINANRIQDLGNGTFSIDGKTLNSRELKSYLASVVDTKQKQGNYVQNTLISRADDTGASRIRDMVVEGAKGNSIYDLLLSKGNSKEISAMTAALFSEHKSAVDLTTTLAIDIENKINSGALDSSFRQDFLYLFNSENFRQSNDKTGHLQRAYNLVSNTSLVDNYLAGQSLAVGSFNKGASIVGMNKQAKLSWTAITNLKSSGFTNRDLSYFGLKSEEALYELRSITEERRLSTNSVNDLIKGKEGRFLNILTQNTEAEGRLDLIKSAFGRASYVLDENPYLTYNLSFRDHSVKSLNFSRLTTNRSGLFDDSSMKMLKDLERRKLDIFLADLDFKETTNSKDRKLAQQRLQSKLDSYDLYTKKMLSGDNNLLKEGLSLYSDKSSIMQVKYIGGNADEFAVKELKKNNHAWFISEDEAEFKAKQLGVTLDWQEVNGYKNIKQPVFKRGNDIIPLTSLVTREPAQGPLSSDLISFYVDSTISKNNVGNIFMPLSNEIYYNAMFGDGDQDTVQTLLGDFQTKKQFEDLENKRKPIRQSFFDLKEVIASMKIKGNKNKMKTIADFEDASSYAQYRVSGGLKGTNRKTLAAPATGLTVSYAKALEMELGHLESASSNLTQGRIMVHQLTENLLKSAHLDTESFQLVNEQEVEKLTRMRSGFLGKKGYEGVTRNQYEEELRKTLPNFLGINSIDTNTISGKQTKEKASSLIDTIINAELNHSQSIGDTPFTPLDLNEKRFSKNSNDFIDSLNSIIKEQGITEIDYEDGIKHLRKSTGQVALGTYDYLLDVAKNNKTVIAGGLAAMAGVALLGREQPNFSDSRSAARQQSASMLRSPGTYDESSQNNTPMGIETNPNKAGYILPKTFGAKGIKVGGDMINGASEMYNEYNSMLDSNNIEDQIYNMSTSIFGDNIRSARLQTNN